MADQPKTTPLLNEYRAGIAKAIQLINEWLITFGDETPQHLQPCQRVNAALKIFSMSLTKKRGSMPKPEPHITTMDTLRQVIALWAAKEAAIEGVWLVGSRAWGSPRPDSDWDLYLKMPADDYAVGTMFSEWDETVARLTGLKTHLISAAVPFQEVGKDPERDGILLYRRE
jgi:hypothetical protein